MEDAHDTTAPDRADSDHGTGHITPKSTLYAQKTGPIRKIVRGEHPLWFMVWVLGIATGLGMMIFWSSLGRAVTTPGSPLNDLLIRFGARTWLMISGPLSGLCGVYLIIVLIGTWRSAARYQGWVGWRWLAWLFVAGSLYLVLRFLFIVLGSLLAASLS